MTWCGIARAQSVPVIWVRQAFKEDLSDAYQAMRDADISITIEGTPGCEVLTELDRSPDDHEMIKKRYSCFFNTGLDDLLRTIHCTTVIVGGVNTHACVRMAAVDAYQRDYRVWLASDCIGSYDKEYHDESMRYLAQSIGQVFSNAAIESLLNAG